MSCLLLTPKICGENQNISDFQITFFFPKILPFMRQCANYCRTRHTTDDNVMRFTCWITKATMTIYSHIWHLLLLTAVQSSLYFDRRPNGTLFILHSRVNNVYFCIVESCIEANKKKKYYFFPMPTKAARTHYIITLYVHCLSYSYKLPWSTLSVLAGLSYRTHCTCIVGIWRLPNSICSGRWKMDCVGNIFIATTPSY